MPGCIFAPYFPPEDPQKFANVHKIFGASNVTKLLNDLLPHQREDAVNSLAYEAEARVRDPVYGCVGAISFLQRQVQRLQKELETANADLIRYACAADIPTALPMPAPQRPTASFQANLAGMRQQQNEVNRLSSSSESAAFYQAAGFHVPYNSLPWNENPSTGGGSGGGGSGI